MNYKSIPQEQSFLSIEDMDERKKTLTLDLENPNVQNNLDETFDYVIKDWMGYFFQLPISTPIFFDLVQNGKLHSFKGTPERLNIILKCLQSRNFDEIISGNPISSDTPLNIDNVIHVSKFGIRVYPFKEIHTRNQRDGSFFNYILKENAPSCFKEQLKRYQIFTSLVNEKGFRKEELEDCCFVYALKVSNQFTEEILNQIRLKIQNRYLPIKCIEEICNEFKIHIILHYITEERNRQISPNNKKFIGVKQEEASYCLEMNLFQKHYFIEEPTPISCYFLKHFDTEDEQNYMKEFNPLRNNYRKARYFCRSSDLVKTLFEKEYFDPITYGHYMVLNTEFHKFQDSDSCDYDLQYDSNYCTKRITNQKVKNNKNKDIFFADFESDVSQDVHKPFLCVISQIDGAEIKYFREGSCYLASPLNGRYSACIGIITLFAAVNAFIVRTFKAGGQSINI